MLFSHDRALPIGVIENVRIENRRLVGLLRFGQSAKASEVFQDVLDGVLSNVSVSYTVDATSPHEGGYPGGLRRICRATTLRDFRAKSILQFGDAPALKEVNEHGEFTHGSASESKTSYKLATFGRIIGVTRQALVNDDLGAFATLAQRFGVAAAECEARVLVSLLTSNPTMNDGKALFHLDHGNLVTGAGSALQLSALTAARAAMRLQKDLDGAPIDATPVYLVVPAALESTAELLLAVIQPTAVASVNPFAGKLALVVDPRLDAISTTAWYLATDPGMVDGLEFAHLEGAEGPSVMTREGWEVDGLEMKCRLYFGAAALDWRSLYRAAGV